MPRTSNSVRTLREARALSQVALAAAAGLSRQSLGAIEAGRAVPSVDVALRLARALDARVEELFSAPDAEALVAQSPEPLAGRVALAHVAGRWVAHALTGDAMRVAADGVATPSRRGEVSVELLRPEAEARENVVLMGCAPVLGALADRLNARAGPGRFLWFSRSSAASLEALGRRSVHLAGVHLVDPRTGEANVADVRRAVAGQPLALVTLARWQAGLLVRPGDAKRIRGVGDLARRGVRLVAREAGAGAQRLLEAKLREAGLGVELGRHATLVASGHLEVARAIAMGAADVGLATQDVALAFGLTFLPLAEERYDLVVPAGQLSDPRLARLFDVVASAPFRRELAELGYDTRASGERVAEVRA
jgi:molybdate-binding protein/DNA-binding XRE family transcriptional regulator